MGRPSFKPSDDQIAQVTGWVKSKVSIEEMARRLKLAPKTFRKHFAAELGLISVETVNTGLASARPREPAFKANDNQREMVLILAGARWPREDIALNIGVTVEVLEEHFADDLRDGPVKFPAPVIQSMWHAARGGNATAAKICLIMNGAGMQKSDQQPSREGLRGKKEQATIAAQRAATGTAWDDLVEPGKPN